MKTNETYRIRKIGSEAITCIAGSLTRKEAYGMLLDLFNDITGNECPNWGAAVRKTSARVYGAFHTMPDGARMFTDDGYIYLAESGEPRGYLYDEDGNIYATEEQA